MQGGASGIDWDLAYRENRTPWDLRGVTPGLEALVARGFLERLRLRPDARVAVVGCGRGHDVRFLAQCGYAVTGFDIAPSAVAEAAELLRLNGAQATVLCRDVLGLSPEFDRSFDLIYEYACLSVLPPHLRSAYARVSSAILAPGGWLLGLFFPLRAELVGWMAGVPYSLREEDLLEHLGRYLDLFDSFAPHASAPGREAAERWFVWRRRFLPEEIAAESAAAAPAGATGAVVAGAG